MEQKTLRKSDFEYTVQNGQAAIVKVSKFFTDKTIPEVLGGYPVTGIGEEAFIECSDFTKIVIPNSVTDIGVQAFYDCSSLTEVTIPNSVTDIGEGAFDNTVVIIAQKDSFAHKYALENKLTFRVISK